MDFSQVERSKKNKKNKNKPAYLDDAVHVRDQAVNADLQQHDQGSANILSDLWVLVGSQSKQTLRTDWKLKKAAGWSVRGSERWCEQLILLRRRTESAPHLYEGVNVVHQSLGPAYDELVDAGDGVGPARQDWSNSSINRCRQAFFL